MRELQFITKIEEYESAAMLGKEDQLLIEKAKQACDLAYAPYSRFKVGAAVLLANGEIVLGSNQENAAYPSGICAERTALFYAGTIHNGVAIKSIAIAASTEQGFVNEVIYPCGACRQVMAEYEQISKKPMRILLSSGSGKVHLVNGMINILPMIFNADNLSGNL
jgi:cytidine deaminase